MSKNTLSKWLVGASLITFLWGVLLIVGSLDAAHRAGRLARMTCDDLIRNGPGADNFITLTDVRICSAGHAFRRDMDAAMEMYVPIFSSRAQQPPQPADIKLILQVLDDRDRDELLARPDIGELNVELWNPAGQLDPWAADWLGSIYPGIQLAKCTVLSVGLHEPSMLHAQSEMHDGLVLLGISLACQFGWWTWRRLDKQSPQIAPSSQASEAHVLVRDP